MQRNVHSSVIDGLVLSGLQPAFVAPELDPELGVAHCLTPDSLAAALDATPDAVAAIVVSPTYFGACADVAGAGRGRARARACRSSSTRPGARTCASTATCRRTRSPCGADLVALLDPQDRRQPDPVGDPPPRRRRPDRRQRSSTAASAWSSRPARARLLTGSLDAARRQAAVHGEELLAETIASLDDPARADPRDPRPRRARRADRRARRASPRWDPLRLVVDVRGTGATGHRIARFLRERDDINLELFSENVVVAVFGIGERAARSRRAPGRRARATPSSGSASRRRQNRGRRSPRRRPGGRRR